LANSDWKPVPVAPGIVQAVRYKGALIECPHQIVEKFGLFRVRCLHEYGVTQGIDFFAQSARDSEFAIRDMLIKQIKVNPRQFLRLTRPVDQKLGEQGDHSAGGALGFAPASPGRSCNVEVCPLE
jgi:hypothetical protein